MMNTKMMTSQVVTRSTVFSSFSKSVTWRNQTRDYRGTHVKPRYTIKNGIKFYNKLKNTILVMEASKGPIAKMAMGLCQAGTTAAIVFGTGCGIALLTTGTTTSLLFTSPPSPSDHQRLLETINLEEDVHTILDASSVRSFVEEKRKLIDARLNLTYFHMVTSLITAGVTSLLSFRVFKNKAFLLQLGNRPTVAVGVGVITPFLMGTLVRSLPRTPNHDDKMIPFGMKEVGHLLYAGSLGLIAAPLYILGGQSMIRSLFVTAGCAAGLHGLFRVLPKTSLLDYEVPLQIAVHAVLISFLLTLVLPSSHYAFTPLYRFMMHGGLLVYSAAYVHALQRMEQGARSRYYDPVNASMSLSMNLLNIFGRLAFMLPPYFQVCRDQMLVVPAHQRPYGFPRQTVNHNNQNTPKPKNGGNNGTDGGNGSGNEM